MTPEQKDLLLKAEDSLKAARLLAKRGFHDFAVSRAYYTLGTFTDKPPKGM
jgi:uncharacterized protein (UPF0332 family)